MLFGWAVNSLHVCIAAAYDEDLEHSIGYFHYASRALSENNVRYDLILCSKTFKT